MTLHVLLQTVTATPHLSTFFLVGPYSLGCERDIIVHAAKEPGVCTHSTAYDTSGKKEAFLLHAW